MLSGDNVLADGPTIYVRGIELISNRTQLYLYNIRGDVIQLLGFDGEVDKTYDYDAYGNEYSRDLADENPLMAIIYQKTIERDDYMEKTHKFIKAIILTVVAIIAILVMLITSNAVYFLVQRHVCNSRVLPIDFPYSEWVSEDGTVSFKVINYVGEGIVNNGEESIRIRVVGHYGDLYALEYFTEEMDGYAIQRWNVKSSNESEVTIKASEKYSGSDIDIFESGATITFYRVDTPSQTE